MLRLNGTVQDEQQQNRISTQCQYHPIYIKVREGVSGVLKGHKNTSKSIKGTLSLTMAVKVLVPPEDRVFTLKGDEPISLHKCVHYLRRRHQTL